MFVWSKLASVKWRDAWEERFLGHGQTNAVISSLPGGKTVRIEVYCAKASEAKKIHAAYGGSVREVKQEEWAAPTAVAGPPMRIRGRLVITNALEPEEAESVRAGEAKVPVLHVPPGLAFGTGDHATTSTCLRVMADFATARAKAGKAWSMADLGTGTGILAMAARVFGATDIHALDFDPLAVKAARANFRRNQIHGVRLEEADLTAWKPRRSYDFIAANVFADVLTLSLPRLRRGLATKGCLVISGILKSDWPDLQSAAAAQGMVFPDVRAKGKWVTAAGGKA